MLALAKISSLKLNTITLTDKKKPWCLHLHCMWKCIEYVWLKKK